MFAPKALARLDIHEPRYGARRSPVMEEVGHDCTVVELFSTTRSAKRSHIQYSKARGT